MKRLVIFLVALALLAGSLPLFAADVTIKEDFIWFGAYDPDLGPGSLVGKARLKFDGKVDDYNSLYIELRAENVLATWNVNDFYLKNFKLTTDVTGALGMQLPFTLKATIGRWDDYFTNWSYYDESGWEFYYGGPNTASPLTTGASWPNLLNWAPESTGAIKFDVGIGPVNLHYLQEFLFAQMLFGADVSFMGANLWLSYGVPNGVFGDGILSIEGKYDTELAGFKLGVAPYFRYAMKDVLANELKWTYGVSAKVGYSMFEVTGGLQGDNIKAADHVVVEASVAPVAAAKVKALMYMDMNAPNSFQAVDLRASYKLGAANWILGWVIGGVDKFLIPVENDTVYPANGLYFGADVSL